LERGGADWAATSLVREPKEPTSLIRGEGLVAVLTCEVGGVEGKGEGGGGGGRRE